MTGFFIANFCVVEPVKITKQPDSISVVEGNCANLSCGAKGFPKPSYQWMKVGYGEIETGFEKNLTLENISIEDAGNYYCQVTNDMSSVSTNIISVQVISPGMSLFLLSNDFPKRLDCSLVNLVLCNFIYFLKFKNLITKQQLNALIYELNV